MSPPDRSYWVWWSGKPDCWNWMLYIYKKKKKKQGFLFIQKERKKMKENERKWNERLVLNCIELCVCVNMTYICSNGSVIRNGYCHQLFLYIFILYPLHLPGNYMFIQGRFNMLVILVHHEKEWVYIYIYILFSICIHKIMQFHSLNLTNPYCDSSFLANKNA
jgi:hypothetical protein